MWAVATLYGNSPNYCSKVIGESAALTTLRSDISVEADRVVNARTLREATQRTDSAGEWFEAFEAAVAIESEKLQGESRVVHHGAHAGSRSLR